MKAIQNGRVRETLTMSSGGSLSAALDLAGYRLAGLDVSSGWDAANAMTFAGAASGTSAFLPIFTASGGEPAVASGALVSATGRSIAFDDALVRALSMHRYLKFRSGPSTAPVNLTTNVTIGALLTPS